MPLVKSPTMTPRKLAANRANGRQSAGPRTYSGKYRGALNALKHGRRSSNAFRSNLLKAGEDVALYDWIYSRILDTFQPVGKRQWRIVQQWARETWCLLRRERSQKFDSAWLRAEGAVWSMAWTPWRQGGLETKPQYTVKTGLRRLSFPALMRLENDSGSRLRFWVRRPHLPTVTARVACDLLTEMLRADGRGNGSPASGEGCAPASGAEMAFKRTHDISEK